MPQTRRPTLLGSVFATFVAAAVYLATPTAAERLAGDCAGAPLNWIAGGELDHEVEVLSWNIQKASNPGWADDLADFADGVHLAFIQEASLQAGIADALPGSLYPAFAQGYTTPQQSTGVMTLSASAPGDHCRMTSIEPWLGTPKATSVTEYALRDDRGTLLAINLHAVNFEFGLATFDAQFQALRTVLDDHEGPVILAGDLNTWNDGRQALVDGLMREYGLDPVTFEPDLRTRAFGRALDHIYVRGLRAEQARVIPVSTSDHNPLRVRLAVL